MIVIRIIIFYLVFYLIYLLLRYINMEFFYVNILLVSEMGNNSLVINY